MIPSSTKKPLLFPTQGNPSFVCRAVIPSTTLLLRALSSPEIANSMHELEVDSGALDPDKLAILFGEMIQMCLWYAFSSDHFELP